MLSKQQLSATNKRPTHYTHVGSRINTVSIPNCICGIMISAPASSVTYRLWVRVLV